MDSESRQGARYLLRFDDICPTMNWFTWEELEEVMVEAGVKPILAVIPDNQDPKLVVSEASPDFWNRVRSWQARGWAIGLHGYQHRYVNAEPGILQLNRQSEFAGLSYQEQSEKLKKGLDIFKREGIQAEVWVAPAHSFDWVTVSALADLGIHTISDGMALRPYSDAQGNVWIPQQFAKMRPIPWGIWTFCYHLNAMSPVDVRSFRRDLIGLSPRTISLKEAAAMGKRSRSIGDSAVGGLRRVVSWLQERTR